MNNKKQEIFSKKQTGFRDGLSYFTLKKEKCHYPASAIKKCRI